MEIQRIISRINRGEKVPNADILERLVGFYEYAVNFSENELYNNHENLEHMVHDMNKLASLISTINMAKSLAETVLDNQLAVADELWRRTNTADYKLSSKSSTIHSRNLRGREDIKPFTLIERLLVSLYYDVGKKIEVLQSACSTLKFEIDKGILDYTIRRKI